MSTTRDADSNPASYTRDIKIVCSYNLKDEPHRFRRYKDMVALYSGYDSNDETHLAALIALLEDTSLALSIVKLNCLSQNPNGVKQDEHVVSRLQAAAANNPNIKSIQFMNDDDDDKEMGGALDIFENGIGNNGGANERMGVEHRICSSALAKLESDGLLDEFLHDLLFEVDSNISFMLLSIRRVPRHERFVMRLLSSLKAATPWATVTLEGFHVTVRWFR